MAVVMTLNEKNIKMVVGGTRKLTATILPNVLDADVEWNSSDTSIAVVDNGNIIGVSEGSVIITASYQELSATCNVAVSESYSLVSLEEAKDRLAIDFDTKDGEIEARIESIMAYIEYATGIKKEDFASLSNSVQELAKDYVLKTLYFDYYDLHSELNDRRLTMIIKQLQLIGANS